MIEKNYIQVCDFSLKGSPAAILMHEVVWKWLENKNKARLAMSCGPCTQGFLSALALHSLLSLINTEAFNVYKDSFAVSGSHRSLHALMVGHMATNVLPAR